MAQKHQAIVDIVANLDPSVRTQFNELITKAEGYRAELTQVNERIRIQKKRIKRC